MEASPLVKAHDHAREASAATHTHDTATAVTEHALAAGEFATAAGDTASAEALRTLRLLEQHHQRLSHILRLSLERKEAEEARANEAAAAVAAEKEQREREREREKERDKEAVLSEKGVEHDKPAPLGSATTTTSVSGVVTRGEFAGGNDGAVADAAPANESPLQALRNAATAAKQAQAGSPGQPGQTGPTGQTAHAAQSAQAAQKNAHRRYPPTRELTSSIANNLASKRGIRGNGSPGPAGAGAGAATATSARQSQRGQPAAPSVSNDLAPGSLDGSPGRGSRAQMQNMLQQQQQQQQAKPSWVPPAVQSPPASHRQQPPQMYMGTDADDMDADDSNAAAKTADDGFSRFYSRFGSIINRLSAPLAFAGLPLAAEEPVPDEARASPQTTQQQPPKQRQKPSPKPSQKENHQRAPSRSRATSQLSSIAASAYSYYNSYGGAGATEPDLSQIYSPAALRAIGAGGGNTNDSFYVVPKTGHTASYANILSFDQKEKRRMAASAHSDDMSDVGVFGKHRSRAAPIAEEEEEDAADDADYADEAHDARDDNDDDGFVDANEPPPRSRNRMHSAKGGGAPDHVLEELYTENQGLKDMLDKLSRRLHAFEASAQSSHMALQESMRFMRPGSPSNDGKALGISASTSSLTPAAAAAATASASAAASLKANRGAGNLSDAEDELARVLAKLEASERERAHQEKTLQKYREKWEKLKAGAKARREAPK